MARASQARRMRISASSTRRPRAVSAIASSRRSTVLRLRLIQPARSRLATMRVSDCGCSRCSAASRAAGIAPARLSVLSRLIVERLGAPAGRSARSRRPSASTARMIRSAGSCRMPARYYASRIALSGRAQREIARRQAVEAPRWHRSPRLVVRPRRLALVALDSCDNARDDDLAGSLREAPALAPAPSVPSWRCGLAVSAVGDNYALLNIGLRGLPSPAQRYREALELRGVRASVNAGIASAGKTYASRIFTRSLAAALRAYD